MSFCQNLLHFTLGQWSESWLGWCRVGLFRCVSPLFMPHLRTLAQEKRSEICQVPVFLFVFIIVAKYNIFPVLTMAPRAKIKILAKWFAHAISEHYRNFEHAYVYWIWLHGSASYVIKLCSATLTNLSAKIAIIYNGTANLRSWYFCVHFEASIERAVNSSLQIQNAVRN